MQLLDKDQYTYEPLHPPLARVAAALGPYLAGYRSQNGGDMWIEGRRHFLREIRPSRYRDAGPGEAGILPFMILCLVLVWIWTGRHVGPVEGALAVVVLGNLPVFLAHSGLATTDAPFAATFAARIFRVRAVARARFRRARAAARRRGRAGGLHQAVGAAVPAGRVRRGAALSLAGAIGRIGGRLRLFASWPSALARARGFSCNGLGDLRLHRPTRSTGSRRLRRRRRRAGRLRRCAASPSFFLGHINLHGSPAFFPVLLLVKSPLPFLAAVAIGAAVLLRWHRRDWRRMAPLVGAAAIVASVIPSTINIGLRHILPAFPLLAIVAAIGLGRLLARPLLSAAHAAVAGLLLLWQVGEAAAAAPDYLSYFNQLAAGEPQRIVTGSDLDWGQDVERLAAALKQRHVDRVSLAVHTSADLRQHDDLPPFETLYPGETATGWIAISEQIRAFYCAGYQLARRLPAGRPHRRFDPPLLRAGAADAAARPGRMRSGSIGAFRSPALRSLRPASPAPRRPA